MRIIWLKNKSEFGHRAVTNFKDKGDRFQNVTRESNGITSMKQPHWKEWEGSRRTGFGNVWNL